MTDAPRDSPKYGVFVSYSHKDTKFVAPLVGFLRLSNDPIFFDRDSIPPGVPWAEYIEAVLNDARMIAVFWCVHSSESVEVRKEYEAAEKAKKEVVPILLDSTPVAPILAKFQWVDLRNLAHGNALSDMHFPKVILSPPPMPTASRSLTFLGGLIVAFLGFFMLTVIAVRERPSTPGGPESVFLISLVLVALFLLWGWKVVIPRRSPEVRRLKGIRHDAVEKEAAHRAAAKIIAEVRRRARDA